MALAGLKRLGLEHFATDVMPLEDFPPAPGQGAICIESRIGDRGIADLVAAIDDAPTAQALACERAWLGALDGSCRMPIAGLATMQGKVLHFDGTILTPDGVKAHRIQRSGAVAEAARIGRAAGEEIRSVAGPGFFEAWS